MVRYSALAFLTVTLWLRGGLVTGQDEGRTSAGGTSRQATETAANSRLKSSIWEFGVVAPGTELQHRFALTNDTDKPWTVKYVTKTCACTVGDFSSRPVKPSEAMSIDVSLLAPNKDGNVHQVIMVDLKEPKSPVLCFVIKGEVHSPFAAVPPVVDFGQIALNQRPTRTVELRNYTDIDLSVAAVRCPDWLKAELQPVPSQGKKDPARQRWKLVLRPDPGMLKLGKATGTLEVVTSSDKIGPLLVPVNMQAKALLSAVPADLTFHTVEAGTVTQRAFFIDAAPELGELTETDLVASHNLGDKLEVRVSKTSTPSRFMVVGHFRPKRANAAVEGELEIKTRKEAAAAVRVRVSAVVK
jgi:hypothetical protein